MTAVHPHQEQRDRALAIANRVRVTVAAWKRETHHLPPVAGALRLADLLCDDEAGDLGRMQIDQALTSVRRLGLTKARRLLNAAQIMRADKRIDEMTWRQRYALSTLLRVEAEKWEDR